MHQGSIPAIIHNGYTCFPQNTNSLLFFVGRFDYYSDLYTSTMSLQNRLGDWFTVELMRTDI